MASPVVGKTDQRLIVQLESAARDRLAQIQFQRAQRHHARIHGRLEEAVGPASIGLGLIHRQIRVLQQLIEIGAVLRSQRNPDTGIGAEQVTETFKRFADRLVNPRQQVRGIRRSCDRGLNDRKFVATEPGNDIRRSQAAAQPTSQGFQEFIADRVAERVVDALELIDVDVEHRQLLAGRKHLERGIELFAKQRPVRQVGQCVVMRHVCDALVKQLAFGDVLVRGHPSAIFHRPGHDVD
jgi:hypothetical protein